MLITHSCLSENLPGASGSAFLDIMVLRMGKPGALFVWAFVCLTAFFVCQTALQAASRTVYAFSRDKGLPDRGFFGYNSTWTQTPLRAIWFVTIIGILPGLLDLASPIALNAIFAMTAMALDLSYIIPIFCRRWYRNHPEVKFVPGPFYMGDGIIGWIANVTCILWTCFVCIIFALPTTLPVTGDTMNYAAVSIHAILRRMSSRLTDRAAHYWRCRPAFAGMVRRWRPETLQGPAVEPDGHQAGEQG